MDLFRGLWGIAFTNAVHKEGRHARVTFFSALAESSHHISRDSTFAVEIRYQSPPTDSIVLERVYRRHADMSTWTGTRKISLKSMPRSVAIRVCSLWDNCVEESARGGCPNHNNGFEPGIIIRQLLRHKKSLLRSEARGICRVHLSVPGLWLFAIWAD
jgi:hypothetical protein